MSAGVAGCFVALACGIVVCLLVLGGALDVSVQIHIPPKLLRQAPDPFEDVLDVALMSNQDRPALSHLEAGQVHRKLQGLPTPHSRQPKYSIYTGKRYCLLTSTLYVCSGAELPMLT